MCLAVLKYASLFKLMSLYFFYSYIKHFGQMYILTAASLFANGYYLLGDSLALPATPRHDYSKFNAGKS